MNLRWILALFIFISFSCEQPSRSGFVEQKTLSIKGRVLDSKTNQPLGNVVIRFYASWDTKGDTVLTNNMGYYLLKAHGVYCEALVGTPADFDPFFFPQDRYFISASKLGYDTFTIGAFAAGIHCFDFTQQVDFKISHMSYYDKEALKNKIDPEQSPPED